ncbi:hypothetical protein CB0940_08002 [Cercospora beticola]|uniref:Uncharacterized protein n=1 Tax=Cercospora beticola TaxID=122368 RepID=A0A2G5HPT0_CERBT|nr:hypothetical protein CB0940_08002 [Cercospora beticola]PIA94232.1 hypothetical protein CB0940_08002 [Cercospora beticola]
MSAVALPPPPPPLHGHRASSMQSFDMRQPSLLVRPALIHPHPIDRSSLPLYYTTFPPAPNSQLPTPRSRKHGPTQHQSSITALAMHAFPHFPLHRPLPQHRRSLTPDTRPSRQSPAP